MGRVRGSMLVMCLTVVVLAATAFGGNVVISHQGRLLSADDTPVSDGFYALTFSLWTDSVGGSMIWTEMQDVQVSHGLFTCALGRLQPLGGAILTHSNNNLYLETSVAGQPLSPRLLLGTVPAAAVASGVSSSVPNAGTMNMSVTDDTTKIDASHQSASGLIDSYVHLTDDRALLGLKVYQPGGSSSNAYTFVSQDSVKDYRDMDDDGDGFPEASLGSVMQSHGSLVRAESELNGLSPRQRISFQTTADSTAMRCGTDFDRDGIPDVAVGSFSSQSRAVLKSYFERGDKPTQSRIIDSVDETGAYEGTIRWNGSDFEGHSVKLMPDSAVVTTEASNPDASSSSNMRVRINELEARLQSLGLLGTSSVTSSLTPGTCSVAIKTKGTGADKNRTISSSTDDSLAVHSLDSDDDGDGVPEVAFSSEVSDKFAQVRGFKVEIDGRRSSYGGTSDSAGSSLDCDMDDDGDGVAERSVWQKVDNTDAITEASVDVNHDGTPDVGTSSKTSVDRAILKSYFERGDKPTASQFAALIDSYAASTTVSVDNNHDGQSEGECKTSSEQNRSYLYTKFENGDIPTQDNIIADTVDPQSARVGLQVTNGSQWSTQSSRCDSDSSGHEVTLTYTPPGMLMPALMKAKEKANRTKCSSNLRTINGSNSSESDISCDTAGTAVMQLSSSTPSGSSTFHLMTGDGSVMHLSRSSSSSSSSATLTADDLGSSLELTDQSGTPTVVITKQGNIGINEPLPFSPIHHGSGARLTAAGDWVNASSRDLKENFQPVDGEDILEKIEQLPISEWNYKAESDDVKHIGPTAQDFKAAFGVGDNDKTISTIDPSGIALAAIKQLKKENNDLKQQVEELKKMVEELAKKK